MINVEPYKAEFLVGIFSSSIEEGLELSKTLKKGGIEAPVFDDLANFHEWVRGNVPHIIIVSSSDFSELESVVDFVTSISSEILCLPVIEQRLLHPTLALAKKNKVYDFWLKPIASEMQVLVKIERALDRLLAQYSQEAPEVTQKQTEHSLVDAPEVRASQPKSFEEKGSIKTSVFSFYENMVGMSVEFALLNEREPLISQFTEGLSQALSNTPVLFFRWVSSSSSLALSNSSIIPLSQYRGLGLQFKEWNKGEAKKNLMDPEGIVQLQTLVKKVFSKDQFNAFPLVSAGEVLGVFVIFDHITGHLERRFLEGAMNVLRSNVERVDYMLRNHQLEVFDHLTGLYNRTYLESCVEREISRSRRTASPLSLVVMELDGANTWHQELGSDGYEALIRLVGRVLGRTGRVNDTLCRIGEGLFVNVLPHTPLDGGLIKAERLRRLVAGTQFKMLQGEAKNQVTLSFGVSEYPSLSLDAESLMRSADDAVATARKKGGNQVIKALAPARFEPDFEPVYHHYKPRERKQASS